jgi:hypothetical protein
MADEKGTHTVESDSDRAEALNRFRSATSIAMTPELFEKLYLSPQSKVKGHLRDTFGNPTPMYVRNWHFTVLFLQYSWSMVEIGLN